MISAALIDVLETAEIELLTAWLSGVPTRQLADSLGTTWDATQIILATVLTRLRESHHAPALVQELLAEGGPKHSATLRDVARALKVDLAPRCQRCGALLPPAARTGRPQLYCNSACRQAAYRKRHRANALQSPAPADGARDIRLGLRDPWAEPDRLQWFSRTTIHHIPEQERLTEWTEFGRRKGHRRGRRLPGNRYRLTEGAVARLESCSTDPDARNSLQWLSYRLLQPTSVYDWRTRMPEPQGRLPVRPIAVEAPLPGPDRRPEIVSPMHTHLPEHPYCFTLLGEAVAVSTWRDFDRKLQSLVSRAAPPSSSP
ncbi:hypothetical protein ACFU6K_07820 [Kitasatospora sp. NPDC057512]|uniref:hypothetical protein n=1 Tax=Kitasatospora sp. NPDC057512 TaxID=3346154 RepID=UPI0036BF2A60